MLKIHHQYDFYLDLMNISIQIQILRANMIFNHLLEYCGYFANSIGISNEIPQNYSFPLITSICSHLLLTMLLLGCASLVPPFQKPL